MVLSYDIPFLDQLVISLLKDWQSGTWDSGLQPRSLENQFNLRIEAQLDFHNRRVKDKSTVGTCYVVVVQCSSSVKREFSCSFWY